MASITVTAQTNVKKTINKADMDLTAKPGENFYEYAAGGWLKSHPLDAVHPWNGAFVDLNEQNNDRIRDLIKGVCCPKDATRHYRTEDRRALSLVYG